MSYPTIGGCHLWIIKPAALTSEQETKAREFLDKHEHYDEDDLKEKNAYLKAVEILKEEEEAKFQKVSALISFLKRLGGFEAIRRSGKSEIDYFICLIFAPDAHNDENDLIDWIRCEIEGWGGTDCEFPKLDDVKAASAEAFFAQVSLQTHHPELDESLEAWALRIAIPTDRAKQFAHTLSACNGDPVLCNELGTARFMRTAEPVSCLVEGLIPHAAITLLIGKRKSGKSTLLTELAVCVARCDAMWAGFDLPQPEEGQGAVLLFSGEDSGAVSGERIKYLDPENKAGLIRIFDGSDDLKKTLAKWEKARISLVIIDPMRKYLAGDEDGSNGPSEFMGFLEDFAKKTGAAVVIAHHTKRGSPVSSLSQVVDAIRGSGAIADRPRVILGLIRHANGVTGLGIAVDDGQPQHNIPPSQAMFEGERLLQRDAATQRHLPIDPEASPVIPNDTLSAVREAIGRAVAAGRRITQRGPHEIWKHGAPELVGKTRAMVRDAVAAGIASGQLVLDGRQVRCA